MNEVKKNEANECHTVIKISINLESGVFSVSWLV